MESQTLGLGGILLVICCVWFSIISLTTSITGSMWVSKEVSRPLKDSYDIVLYGTGSSHIGIRNYILNHPGNNLSSDQVDLALIHVPSIIFKDVSPSNANRIVNDIMKQGGLAEAI